MVLIVVAYTTGIPGSKSYREYLGIIETVSKNDLQAKKSTGTEKWNRTILDFTHTRRV